MAREMRDSGVAWLGAIPVNWKFDRVKHYYTTHKFVVGESADKYERLALTLNGVIKRPKEDRTGLQPDAFNGYQVLKRGELVFKLIDLENVSTSRVGFSPYTGIVSPAYIVLKPNRTVNPRFGYYYFISLWQREIFNHLGDDGVRSSLNANDLLNLPYLFPLLDDQNQIVVYLDRKCSEIDAVLKKTRDSIEEYKKLKQAIITQAVTKGIRGERPMKNSGVAWIGIIPSEWDVSALGKFITIDSGISVGKKYELGTPLVEVPYLRVANVQGDHVDLSDVATIMVTPEEAEKYKLKNGQLLMTEGGDRDKLGRGCLWNGEIENCIHQNHIFSVQTNDRLTVRYLDYLTTSEVARVYFDLTAKKTTNLACTNKSTIQKFVIPIPKVAEQEAICDYLDGECKKLDRVLQAKANIIEQLNNYKKSLIYEYVTGKREVPETKNQSFISFIDARALLMCRIIELLKPKGRIHLMKALYTVDCMLNLNSTTQYQRQKHGPYDTRIEEYEKRLVQNGWIDIKYGSPVEYMLTETFETYREMYQSYYENVDGEVQRLCAFLQPMKTSKAERVATLLAAWNDFVIQGIVPTNNQLVQEVRSNWTPNKAHSSESTWLGTLAEMKVHKIIPLGYGKCTVHMK